MMDETHERLVLGDLLNHVLDKGVVITGDVVISIADIDLVRVGLSIVLAAAETLDASERRADLSVLPPAR
jgi:hypothetical protein